MAIHTTAQALSAFSPPDLVGKYILGPGPNECEPCGWPAQIIATTKTTVRAVHMCRSSWEEAAGVHVPGLEPETEVVSFQLRRIRYVCDTAEEAQGLFLQSEIAGMRLMIAKAELEAAFRAEALAVLPCPADQLSMLTDWRVRKRELRI